MQFRIILLIVYKFMHFLSNFVVKWILADIFKFPISEVHKFLHLLTDLSKNVLNYAFFNKFIDKRIILHIFEFQMSDISTSLFIYG